MYIAIVDVEDMCLTVHNLLHCSSVPVKRRERGGDRRGRKRRGRKRRGRKGEKGRKGRKKEGREKSGGRRREERGKGRYIRAGK